MLERFFRILKSEDSKSRQNRWILEILNRIFEISDSDLLYGCGMVTWRCRHVTTPFHGALVASRPEMARRLQKAVKAVGISKFGFYL